MTKNRLKNFINGEWVEAKTEKYEQVPNPATGEVLAEVPISTEEDVKRCGSSSISSISNVE